MAFENSAGLGVNNHYGARNTGGTVGVEQSQDSIHQMSVAFTGDSLQSTYMSPFVLPRGAKFLQYLLRVDEAFVVTGTNPTLIFGGTLPATNGVVLTEAELETIGTKPVTSTGTGTWAVASTTGTTAAERVTRAIGGTGSPAIAAGVGKGTLIAEYIFKTKV